MQNGVNVIVVEGGLVKLPELKYTADGLAYTSFSIANSSLAFKGGEKTEEVSYFDVSAWGKLAEVCATFLNKKGRKIIVSGKLKQSRWKDKEGNTKSKISITAQDIKFLPVSRQKNK